MALKYHEEAKKNGVYIVGACGWDSIPCDVGIQYAIREFNGQLDSIETVAEFSIPKVISNKIDWLISMINRILLGGPNSLWYIPNYDLYDSAQKWINGYTSSSAYRAITEEQS